MIEIANKIRESTINLSNSPGLRAFFKENPDMDFKFRNLWKKLDPHEGRGITYKVSCILSAHPEDVSPKGLKLHINAYFIDKEGEVSPSKFVILRKINTEIDNIIINATSNFPLDFKTVGRCELLRRDMFNFPKCKNCNNLTSWYNSSHLLDFCSTECGNESRLTKEKRNETMTSLYGIENYTQVEDFQIKAKATKKEKYNNENYTNREKAKETWLKIYGLDNPLKDKEVRQKIKNTMIKNHGVENYVDHVDFKNKSEKTCLEHFGYRHQAQSPEIYKKIQSSLFTVKKYKNTNLNYQGSYELYFLELMEEKGLLNEISIPEPVSYQLNNQEHIYNPDFMFSRKIIEIKSSWTYNRNGKDKLLEEKNHVKWNSVKEKNIKIIVLMDKKEIKKFVDCL